MIKVTLKNGDILEFNGACVEAQGRSFCFFVALYFCEAKCPSP
ncbi:hypothetical protein [Sporomusa sphaeroides]|uniref:Uncharacterized protein n=1 Tax=Sporomusa sphaeroides DSM 2875 TaxID=1337886 RepID=A0ABM9W0W8_9FIRM|nr:hypothetical protein [Sporomusa sphaeroides]OLS55802.1 hypothetical protein SPSPH_31320 [Sporomusa sphaeroides DSM 2875]CVK18803.1 hypothetical protein SSPH_01447 [Sporomusa sphaeroides DSM 2875]